MTEQPEVEKAASRVEEALREGEEPDPADETVVGDATTAPVPPGLAWLRGRGK